MLYHDPVNLANADVETHVVSNGKSARVEDHFDERRTQIREERTYVRVSDTEV